MEGHHLSHRPAPLVFPDSLSSLALSSEKFKSTLSMQITPEENIWKQMNITHNPPPSPTTPLPPQRPLSNDFFGVWGSSSLAGLSMQLPKQQKDTGSVHVMMSQCNCEKTAANTKSHPVLGHPLGSTKAVSKNRRNAQKSKFLYRCEVPERQHIALLQFLPLINGHLWRQVMRMLGSSSLWG